MKILTHSKTVLALVGASAVLVFATARIASADVSSIAAPAPIQLGNKDGGKLGEELGNKDGGKLGEELGGKDGGKLGEELGGKDGGKLGEAL